MVSQAKAIDNDNYYFTIVKKIQDYLTKFTFNLII